MSGEQHQRIDPEELLTSNLDMVDRIARGVCRRSGMRCAQEVDDFVSSVTFALMEDGYAILRRWEGRASLAGYLCVVIRRLFCARCDHERGKWHASAEATRCGRAGVLLEKLLIHDRRPFEEAVPLVRQLDPSHSSAELVAMAGRFPARAARPYMVNLDTAEEMSVPAPDRADHRVLDGEARWLSRRASEVVRAALAAWSDQDAAIIRLHFGASKTIAEISRALSLPQRPIYRRIEALIARLRTALVRAGLDASMLGGIIGTSSQEMDFGLGPAVANG
jgi:RNA polymerase sigma factor (sigma-70 family)